MGLLVKKKTDKQAFFEVMMAPIVSSRSRLSMLEDPELAIMPCAVCLEPMAPQDVFDYVPVSKERVEVAVCSEQCREILNGNN